MGWSLKKKTGKGWGRKCLFFFKISTDDIAKTGLEEDCTAMLLARSPAGIGAPLLVGRVFPVEAEMCSTVQLWFLIVTSEHQAV